MLPFFAQKLLAVGGAITGHDAPQVLKSTATSNTYALGDITGVQVGDLVTLHLHALIANSGNSPSAFTATLGGVSFGAAINATATPAANTMPGSAGFQMIAGAAGTLALAVDLATSGRACIAIVTLTRGHDVADPLGQTAQPSVLNTAVSTLGVPGAGIALGAVGNVYLASVNIKGGDQTAMSMAAMDGSGSDTTGTGDVTSNISAVWGWVTATSTTTINPAGNWTTGNRCSALGTEINL